jgi:predicted amidophosphoribosyltransferase
MARRKRLRCKECGELIDFEDLTYCERCDAPLHEWCTTSSRYFEDGVYCSECAEELDEEIEDSDEYGYSLSTCPICGTSLVREENLVWCPNCGYEPF